MTLISKRSLIVLLSLASLFSGNAANAGFVFLREDSVDIRNFPPPPRSGSAEDAIDLNGVRAYQDKRTSEECARANDEAHITAASFFGPRRGVLTKDELASIKEIFLDVSNDSQPFIRPLKKEFARLRPFLRDPRIELCVPLVSGFAYPSGHAALGRVSARVLALVFPNRARQLMDRGDEVGLDRIIGGVHHPRDVAAGRLLGDDIFDALLKSPEFRRRIEELRAARRFRAGRRH